MGAEKKKSQKRKLIVFGIEIVVILVMIGVLYFVMRKPEGDAIGYIEIPYEELEIHEEVQKMTEEEEGTMHGYMNIALFGVDATSDKELYKTSRSDCTMIASINLDTKEIKLVSVYRDSYLNLSDDTYNKCNGAYFYGGAEQAIRMLNMNLDMNIEKFIAVGYKGLSEVIDGLGGIYVDVNDSELDHINNYQITIIGTDMMKGIENYTPVTKTGYQKLNGVQAAAYCRIRYGDGKGDFGRASRQREVLMAIEEQAKKSDAATLAKVFDSATKDIYTNFKTEEILELLPTVVNYKITEQDGFPQEDMRTVKNMGTKGSCVVPMNLEDNVVWLHKFLFDDDDYTVTSSVKEISEKVQKDYNTYVND